MGIEKNDNEPFLGKDPVECRFEKKEIVEFLYADKLDVGIVFGQPLTPGKVKSANKKLWDKLQLRCDQSDNTYLIDTGLNDFIPSCVQDYSIIRRFIRRYRLERQGEIPKSRCFLLFENMECLRPLKHSMAAISVKASLWLATARP